MHVLIVPSEHFVTERYPTGGIFQRHQAEALAAGGHQVGVLNVGVVSPRFMFQTYPYPGFEKMNGIPVYRRFERKLTLQRAAPPAATARTHARLGLPLYETYCRAYGRPDIVHAHNLLYGSALAHAIRANDGVPYVITEHSAVFTQGGLTAAETAACEPILRAASAVTAVSGALARRMRLQLGLHDDVRVLPNVVDPAFARSASRPARAADGPVFLTVGSLDENKNHVMLIDAFAAAFRNTDAVLRIAGEGHLHTALETRAATRGVGNQVRLLGPLGRDGVRREMLAADCFVLSSRSETFGVVLIEALACGTPVVATRCGGPEDVVHDGNGVLVDNGDTAALAGAMQRIAERGASAPAVLREDCLRRFGSEAFCRNALDFYEAAVGGAHAH